MSDVFAHAPSPSRRLEASGDAPLPAQVLPDIAPPSTVKPLQATEAGPDCPSPQSGLHRPVPLEGPLSGDPTDEVTGIDDLDDLPIILDPDDPAASEATDDEDPGDDSDVPDRLHAGVGQGNGCRRLACAVLLQAAKDGRTSWAGDAREFLAGTTPECLRHLTWWCQVAGIDVGEVIAYAKRLRYHLPMTPWARAQVRAAGRTAEA